MKVLSLASFVFSGCAAPSPSTESADAMVPTAGADTLYVDAPEGLIMEVREQGHLKRRKVFSQVSDTVYAASGRVQSVAVGEHTDVAGTYYEYHANGRLKSVAQQGIEFGCGIKVGEELQYDTLGRLISRVAFANELLKGSAGCHDIHTVVTTTTFHMNGTPSSHTQQEQFYESDVCSCGTWEFFSAEGRSIREEVHESCTDGVLECTVAAVDR